MWVQGIKRGFRKFRKSEDGNVALMFAVTLTTLLSGISVAVTYADINRSKVELQKAVDASALAAARISETEDNPSNANSQSNVALSLSDRKEIARKVFANNLDPRFGAITPEIDVREEGEKLIATVSVDYTVESFMRGVIPKDMTRFTTTSSAESAEGGLFTDIYVLLDNSTSMGIGQTDSERWRMLRDPNMRGVGKQPCAVACHMPGDPQGTYQYYKSEGIRMRIDAVTDALENFVTAMKAEGPKTEHTRYNIRVTGDMEYPSTIAGGARFLNTHDEALLAAQTIELDGRPGRTNTQIHRSLAWHESEVAVAGQGTSNTDRQAFLILMTDGLENTKTTPPTFLEGAGSRPDPSSLQTEATAYLTETDPSRIATMDNYEIWDYAQTSQEVEDRAFVLQPINPAICQPLKDKNVTVMVMNIEYGIPEFRSKTNGTFPRYDERYANGDLIMPPWDGGRDALVLDLKPQIDIALRACASDPDLVFSVESESQMQRAFDQINKEITSRKSVRLKR